MSKIPQELFVTSKVVKEREYIWDKISEKWKDTPETEYLFGFLHPHEPKLKPDASRKRTQIDWAYPQFHCIEQDPITFRISARLEKKHPVNGGALYAPSTDKRGTWFGGPILDIRQEIDEEVQPRIWKNEPLSGFMIIDTVNRYRGNKLFKVQDPRGVIFEVTVASLFQIISNGSIINGVIQNECVWKANKNLILV